MNLIEATANFAMFSALRKMHAGEEDDASIVGACDFPKSIYAERFEPYDPILILL